MDLTEKKCVPCQGGVPPMSPAEAHQMIESAPFWELIESDSKLRRTFRFDNFMQAQAFACRVGELAEQENHHPDICYGWGYCTVVFFTHKIGGLHLNDFIMAAKTGALLD